MPCTRLRRTFYQQLGRYWLILGFSLTLWLAYSVYIFDYWYYSRYLFATLLIPIFNDRLLSRYLYNNIIICRYHPDQNG